MLIRPSSLGLDSVNERIATLDDKSLHVLLQEIPFVDVAQPRYFTRFCGKALIVLVLDGQEREASYYPRRTFTSAGRLPLPTILPCLLGYSPVLNTDSTWH